MSSSFRYLLIIILFGFSQTSLAGRCSEGDCCRSCSDCSRCQHCSLEGNSCSICDTFNYKPCDTLVIYGKEPTKTIYSNNSLNGYSNYNSDRNPNINNRKYIVIYKDYQIEEDNLLSGLILLIILVVILRTLIKYVPIIVKTKNKLKAIK